MTRIILASQFGMIATTQCLLLLSQVGAHDGVVDVTTDDNVLDTTAAKNETDTPKEDEEDEFVSRLAPALFVSFFCAYFCLAIYVCYIKCCRDREAQEEEQQQQRQNAVTITQEDALREIQLQALQKRLEFLQRVMQTRTWTRKNRAPEGRQNSGLQRRISSEAETSKQQQQAQNEEDLEAPAATEQIAKDAPAAATSLAAQQAQILNRMLTTSDADDEDDCCPICLVPYQQHNETVICHSNNSKCCHEFHPECMTKWLLKHEWCPICHETYYLETVGV